MPSVTAIIHISHRTNYVKINCSYLLIFIDYLLISDHVTLAVSNFKKNEWRAITAWDKSLRPPLEKGTF